MDREPTNRPVTYWRHLEGVVTAKVGAAMRWNDEQRQPIIEYLRDLEKMARCECDRRETIQLIASARRVLGDRTMVGPLDGPFSRSMGAER